MKSLWLTVCVALFVVSCTPSHDEPIQWPTDGWAVSSPEAQGMDAARLAALDSSLADDHGNIDGMLVIRNGRVVYERLYPRDYNAMNEGRGQAPGLYNYYDPEWHPYYQRGELHTVQSVTKSVTSALIGIAIGRGEIAGLHVPVLEEVHDSARPPDHESRDQVGRRLCSVHGPRKLLRRYGKQRRLDPVRRRPTHV
jgi:CubicO group peptidase (beta-lactamase class C family)